jgi:tetratricopeptide (TPR) repeat protein
MSGILSTLKALTLSGLFLWAPALGASSPYILFSAEAQQTYHHILALRLDEAQMDLRVLKRQQPHNRVDAYLQGSIDFARCLSLGREEYCRHCLDQMPVHLDALRKGPPSSAWQTYALGELHAMMGLVYYLDGSSWKAARHLRQAVRHIREGARAYPAFLPLQKDLLLLRYLVDAVPEPYTWLAEWITGLPRPTQADAWGRLLTQMQRERHAMWLEASLYDLLIQVQSPGNSASAMQAALKLHEAYPRHPMVGFVMAYTMRETGHNDLAIEALQDMDRTPMPYLELMLGKSLLYRLEIPKAVVHLDRFESQWTGHRHRLEACQKRAWCELLGGFAQAYSQRLDDCAAIAHKSQESDAQAWYEWKQKRTPHVGLLRARLLMDGGYLDRAMGEIRRMNVQDLPDADQRLEYHYRKGRIAQALDRYEEATAALQTAWLEGRGKEMHFACAAALHLGHLYASRQQSARARQWYERCLKEKPAIYKEGLHIKARLALRHLEG